ncbi:hypothetical protein HPB49_007773 [Dermacentor silvarum]|uniref:Uncharacterized protein n=1 Tax=Dermacentor silvarum TaxID=543639 RepID=A0ACB8CW35_DERSI|nr:hypothetical protein HPB49_007773 [Dermacentor silvarum]
MAAVYPRTSHCRNLFQRVVNMEEVHNQPAHSRMKPSKAARVEFNDRLIADVQKRPVLWDCCRPDNKDQRKKMTAWEEVAAECGRDPDDSTDDTQSQETDWIYSPQSSTPEVATPEAATPEVDMPATSGGSVTKRIPRKLGKKSKADVEIDSLQELLKTDEDERPCLAKLWPISYGHSPSE